MAIHGVTGEADWGSWVQGAVGSVLDTRLDVYKSQNMQSYEPATGRTYQDGKPSVAGISANTLWVIGGGALVLLAVSLMLKD